MRMPTEIFCISRLFPRRSTFCAAALHAVRRLKDKDGTPFVPRLRPCYELERGVDDSQRESDVAAAARTMRCYDQESLPALQWFCAFVSVKRAPSHACYIIRYSRCTTRKILFAGDEYYVLMFMEREGRGQQAAFLLTTTSLTRCHARHARLLVTLSLLPERRCRFKIFDSFISSRLLVVSVTARELDCCWQRQRIRNQRVEGVMMLIDTSESAPRRDV